MARQDREDPKGRNTSGDSNVTNLAEVRQKRESRKSSAQATTGKSRSTGGRSINYEKVAALKASIENGTYRINARRIADKFIESEGPR